MQETLPEYIAQYPNRKQAPIFSSSSLGLHSPDQKKETLSNSLELFLSRLCGRNSRETLFSFIFLLSPNPKTRRQSSQNLPYTKGKFQKGFFIS
jgi:hypothetical protein